MLRAADERGDAQIARICESLAGRQSIVTEEDVRRAPVLSGRAVEDVCRRPSPWQEIARVARARWRPPPGGAP